MSSVTTIVASHPLSPAEAACAARNSIVKTIDFFYAHLFSYLVAHAHIRAHIHNHGNTPAPTTDTHTKKMFCLLYHSLR